MSMGSRVKSLLGGDDAPNLTAATTMAVPDNSNFITLTGTASVTSLTASNSARNREVTFLGVSGTTTFTNSNDPTTVGAMDLGGSNRAVATQDVLVLILKTNGTWVMKSFTDN